MTPEAMGALIRMGGALTRDAAQECAQEAARLGASPAELAEAWAEWDALQDAQVTVIGGGS